MATGGTSDAMRERMAHIKHVLVVMSGKGGVGKSTVASQLALAFSRAGKRVGILDVDLCGPSIPRMTGLEGHEVHQSTQGWVPVYLDSAKTLAVMSIGFLLPSRDSAVVWRGPKKNATIKQFLEDVCWGELDYLIIDTPPGTSDEHITVCEQLLGFEPDGAIMVTTPQKVALMDVRREISFCRKLGLPIIGLLENMSGFVCPTCSECSNVFSKGGGERLAAASSVPFLGRIPIDPRLSACVEEGRSFFERFPDSPSLAAISDFVRRTIETNDAAESMQVAAAE